jgi:hypothetical protein
MVEIIAEEIVEFLFRFVFFAALFVWGRGAFCSSCCGELEMWALALRAERESLFLGYL